MPSAAWQLFLSWVAPVAAMPANLRRYRQESIPILFLTRTMQAEAN